MKGLSRWRHGSEKQAFLVDGAGCWELLSCTINMKQRKWLGSKGSLKLSDPVPIDVLSPALHIAPPTGDGVFKCLPLWRHHYRCEWDILNIQLPYTQLSVSKQGTVAGTVTWTHSLEIHLIDHSNFYVYVCIFNTERHIPRSPMQRIHIVGCIFAN